MTQLDKVKNLLYTGAWIPIPMFLRAGVVRYGARMWELRKQGWTIISREVRRKNKAGEMVRHVSYRKF